MFRLTKARLGPDHSDTLRTERALVAALLQAGKPAEAEPLLRARLAAQQSKQSEDWVTYETQSRLGAALLAQKKYAEAEPLLLAGYEGMNQREAKMAAERQIPPDRGSGATRATVRRPRRCEEGGRLATKARASEGRAVAGEVQVAARAKMSAGPIG